MLWSPPVSSLPRQHRANDDLPGRRRVDGDLTEHTAAASDPVREASQRVPAAPMTRIRPAIPCVAAADVAAVGHRSLRCRAITIRRLTSMAGPSR